VQLVNAYEVFFIVYLQGLKISFTVFTAKKYSDTVIPRCLFCHSGNQTHAV